MYSSMDLDRLERSGRDISNSMARGEMLSAIPHSRISRILNLRH